MGAVWVSESVFLTWLSFPCSLCLLGYLGAFCYFIPGQLIMGRLLKVKHVSPLHNLPWKLLSGSSASVKWKSALTTLVISISHTSTFGLCRVHVIPPRSCISFAHCHRLQCGTKFTFKFNLKQNEKARKSWKGKLAAAINMDLTARFFWFIHQMWGREICSEAQLLKVWPWLQGTANQRNSSWHGPVLNAHCQLQTAGHTVE